MSPAPFAQAMLATLLTVEDVRSLLALVDPAAELALARSGGGVALMATLKGASSVLGYVVDVRGVGALLEERDAARVPVRVKGTMLRDGERVETPWEAVSEDGAWRFECADAANDTAPWSVHRIGDRRTYPSFPSLIAARAAVARGRLAVGVDGDREVRAAANIARAHAALRQINARCGAYARFLATWKEDLAQLGALAFERRLWALGHDLWWAWTPSWEELSVGKSPTGNHDTNGGTMDSKGTISITIQPVKTGARVKVTNGHELLSEPQHAVVLNTYDSEEDARLAWAYAAEEEDA